MKCPNTVIQNGRLDSSCNRNPGEICTFLCFDGFRATHSPNSSYVHDKHSIKCTSFSTWNKPLSSLCERIRCPQSIPNGRVYSSCSRYINTVCDGYYCNSGFQRSRDSYYLTCNASGEWEWDQYSTEKFCLGEEELCPSDIKNGSLANSCRRTEGSFCRYYCNTGCKYSYSISYLICKNKTWGRDTELLCTDCQTTTATTASAVRCPSVIPNGYVSLSCNRSPHSSCYYYCDSSCSKYLTAIQCSAYGEWYSANRACYCPVSNVKCPYSIPNGYIYGSCDYTPGSSCSVSCYSGCYTVYSAIYCDRSGHWDVDNLACHCRESTTEMPDDSNLPRIGGDSDSGNISALGITGIVLAFCFLVFVIVGCRFVNKRLTSNSANQSTTGQSVLQQTTTTANAVDRFDLSHCQAVVDTQQIESNNLSQEPPSYDDIAIVKSDPLEPPPSYEEVTAHPLSFNIDHRSTSVWSNDYSAV